MLHLVQSNKMESLAAVLIGWLQQNQGGIEDIFVPDSILVQSPGMAQWLKIEIGEALGVAANLDFPLPSSFIWQLYRQHISDLPEQSAFTKDNMTWKLMDILPASLKQPEFATIEQYLSDDTPLKLYQLCHKIADIYDQYLVYRPQWILAWEQGENTLDDTDVSQQPWQPILWRQLVACAAQLQESPFHRANLHQALLSKLAGEDASSESKPLFVFGLSAMPVQQLEILKALAEHREVIIFWFNPSQHYWGDIVDSKTLLKSQLKQPDNKSEELPGSDDYLLVGNPLLASWGKLGRDYQDMLLNLDIEQHDVFIEREPGNILEYIQHEVLELTCRGASEPLSPDELLSNGIEYHKIAIAGDDHSVQVHACHSKVRELEVLHDQLLHLFAANPQWHPGDVIVMMPDVASYAPVIDGVFGGMQGALAIPYAISDRNVEQESPLLNSFMQLMSLHHSRLALSDVLALCEVPAIQRQFELSAAEFDLLHVWLTKAGVRWGWNGEDKTRWALPQETQNTWLFGLQRLLSGYAMGGENLFSAQGQVIAPYAEIEGQQAVALGKFYLFSQHLSRALEFCQSSATIADKVAGALDFIDIFYLAEDDDQGYLLQLRQSLEQMLAHQEQYVQPIEQDIFVAELEQNLTSKGVGQRFLAGYVNFCTLMPMRSVPFKVVCLLGLNDGDYPRQVVPMGFDLMRQSKARRGDRSRRLDDRYLFLEAILSARSQLYLSYLGYSAKDNSARSPSILLSELLEYTSQSFCLAGDELLAVKDTEQNWWQHLYTEHALQPFHPRYFSADGKDCTTHLSYQQQWLTLAKQQAGNKGVVKQAKDFFARPLAPALGDDPLDVLELDELMAFFNNPAKAFFNKRWQTRMSGINQGVNDDEPFEFDALERFTLNERLVQGQQKDWHSRLMAEGKLPMGNAGALSLQPLEKQSQELAAKLAGLIGDHPAKRVEVALSFTLPKQVDALDAATDPIVLGGWVDTLFDGNLLLWRPGKVRGNDIVRLWLSWLSLCANGSIASNKEAHFVGVGDKQHFIIPALGVEDAHQQLALFVNYWLEGQQKIIHFYPKSAWAWVTSTDQGKTLGVFNGSHFVPGEGAEPHIHRACADLAEHFSQFTDVSETLLAGLLARKGGDA